MSMQCRVTSRTILALRSTTKQEQVMEALEVKEEEEDLVEVEDKLIAIDVDSKDTMQEIVPTPPQYVSIANPMNILLMTSLFYRVSCRKRDRSWEIKMFSRLVLRIALHIRTLISSHKAD